MTLYPGCYLLGRNIPNVRVFYAGFFGSTLLFSLLFAWLGEIGSSEVNRVRSAATAHQLEDGLYDVTQWSSVAAVNGGTYELQHHGTGRLYSTCQEFEAVNGIITTGANGALTLDMPPVSTRTVLNRMRMPGMSLGLRIESFLADERGLSALSLSTGEQFPQDAETAFAAYRGRIHPLAILDNRLSLKDRGIPTSTFVNSFELLGWQRPGWGAPPTTNQLDEEDVMFENMLRMLIGNSYQLRGQSAAELLVLPADLVRIFIYAPMPAEFSVTGEEFQEQQGRVLYVVDLPVAYEPSLETSE